MLYVFNSQKRTAYENHLFMIGATLVMFVVTCCLDFRNRYPDRSNDD